MNQPTPETIVPLSSHLDVIRAGISARRIGIARRREVGMPLDASQKKKVEVSV